MISMRHLPGPSLMGFYGMFERDFGDPSTNPVKCTVAPSCIGAVLLPFPCPRCGRTVDFSNPSTRNEYRDQRPGRANHWCPWCGFRFRLDSRGVPVNMTAPARVAGEVPMRQPTASAHLAGIDILGADDAGEPASDAGDELPPEEAPENEPMDFAETVEEAFNEAGDGRPLDEDYFGGGSGGGGFAPMDPSSAPTVTTSTAPSSTPQPAPAPESTAHTRAARRPKETAAEHRRRQIQAQARTLPGSGTLPKHGYAVTDSGLRRTRT